MVPWLEEEDQKLIFPPGVTFPTREAHAEFIMKEARDRTHMACKFTVIFYVGENLVCRGAGGWLKSRRQSAADHLGLRSAADSTVPATSALTQPTDQPTT